MGPPAAAFSVTAKEKPLTGASQAPREPMPRSVSDSGDKVNPDADAIAGQRGLVW